MSCDSVFTVEAGETFNPVVRWGTTTLVSKPITGISQAAPVVITAVGHGLTDGWEAAVVSAKGCTQINAERYPPQGNDWHAATLIDANTVSFNDVNSADMGAYTSGGFLVYSTPVDLAGATATMTFRDAPDGGSVLTTLTELSGIAINNAAKTITPTLATAGLTWTTGYFELMMTVGGNSTMVLEGTLIIE